MEKKTIKENALVLSLIFGTVVILGVYFNAFMIAVASTICIVLVIFTAHFIYLYQRRSNDKKSIKELGLDHIDFYRKNRKEEQ